VTSVDAKVGELVTAGSPVVSVISYNDYQVRANLAESDLVKVRVGANADIVLDSYSSDTVFRAIVSSVDPAETVLDGVAVYQITLQFIESDDRIKSGLTADVTIKGERRDNVFAVPQRAVITRSGGKYVQVLQGEQVVEKAVKTGLRGSDGNIEITDGLTGGEQVVVFVED
jgi:RND family efflux transporter MFP subunit